MLAGVVAEFVVRGIAAGDPAVIIATSSHSAAVERALIGRGIDVPGLRAARRFTVLDAEAVLHEISIDGMPTAARFRPVIVPLLEDAAQLSPSSTVHAYGEMVDVLWQAGRTLAATRLEILWNSLRTTHKFSLLCGYAMGNVYDDDAVGEICSHHTHVMAASGETAVIA